MAAPVAATIAAPMTLKDRSICLLDAMLSCDAFVISDVNDAVSAVNEMAIFPIMIDIAVS